VGGLRPHQPVAFPHALARVPVATRSPCWRSSSFGLHLAFAGNYGWHIDELYFVASSRFLDWGYVDYLPLTPFSPASTRPSSRTPSSRCVPFPLRRALPSSS
jgi:hypothetical protein